MVTSILGNKVLLVEDEPINQALIGSMLESSGYNFDLAKNGTNAFKLATTNIYQLILMDIGLPDINGIDVTRKIRSKDKNQKQAPIVALTSHTDEETKDKCLASGMNEFANKPINKDSLCSIIRKYLDKH